MKDSVTIHKILR